jgi:hypothetical protein
MSNDKITVWDRARSVCMTIKRTWHARNGIHHDLQTALVSALHSKLPIHQSIIQRFSGAINQSIRSRALRAPSFPFSYLMTRPTTSHHSERADCAHQRPLFWSSAKKDRNFWTLSHWFVAFELKFAFFLPQQIYTDFVFSPRTMKFEVKWLPSCNRRNHLFWTGTTFCPKIAS